MSQPIGTLGILLLASSPAWLHAQQRNVDEAPSPEAVQTETTEGRTFDEGQVQVPQQGQVEDLPEGQVEPIHPTGSQPATQDTQPDLFRFESRHFNRIPKDE